MRRRTPFGRRSSWASSSNSLEGGTPTDGRSAKTARPFAWPGQQRHRQAGPQGWPSVPGSGHESAADGAAEPFLAEECRISSAVASVEPARKTNRARRARARRVLP